MRAVITAAAKTDDPGG